MRYVQNYDIFVWVSGNNLSWQDKDEKIAMNLQDNAIFNNLKKQ